MTRDDVVVVPREPTTEMRVAGVQAWRDDETDAPVTRIYQAMIAASPSASADRGGWHPIETAPKDGTVVAALALSRLGELYDSPTFRPFTCWWSEAGEFSPAGWAREVFGWQTRGTHVAHPTHWQPLPEPPALQQKGEET